MDNILTFVANMINHIAVMGGGLPSAGFSYNPIKPLNLKEYIQNHPKKSIFKVQDKQ